MKILDSVRTFLQKTSVSARDFLSLLGQLNAAADFVMLGWLHLRPLQMSLHNQWQPQKFLLCHQIGMTTKILQHLKWWHPEDLYRHGIPMKIDPPSHTIFTDASLSGWGAHVKPEGLLAKPTLSRWVKYAIKNAYDTISKNPNRLFKPRAHELRAISTSWAYMNYIPLEEILKSAVWSSTSLFASHYLRDFREQTENLRAMGPIIAAQKVVGGRANPVSHQDK